MDFIYLKSMAFFLGILAVVIVNAQDEEGEEEEAEEDEDDNLPFLMRQVVEGNNHFTRNYFKMIRDAHPNDNFVVSPFSISILMGMLMDGTSNPEITSELRSALKVNSSLSAKNVKSGMAELISNIYNDLEDAESEETIKLLQRIYIPSTHPVRDNYKDKIVDNFHSTVKNVNYETTVSAVERINTWMADSSNGEFKTILPSPDSIFKGSSLLLLSAGIFNGKFEKPFVNVKRNQTFFTKSTSESSAFKEVTTTMINRIGIYKYVDLGYMRTHAVAIPYSIPRFELVIFLPKRTDGLEWPLEQMILKENFSWVGVISNMTERPVNVTLPEFELKTSYPFTNQDPELQQLGLTKTTLVRTAESSKYDKMSRSTAHGLHVDKILQKCKFQITRGTNPAPSDDQDDESESDEEDEDDYIDRGRQDQIGINFNANHPFVGFIRDKETNLILMVLRKVK